MTQQEQQEQQAETFADRLGQLCKDIGVYNMPKSDLAEQLLQIPEIDFATFSFNQLSIYLFALGRHLVHLRYRYDKFKITVRYMIRNYEFKLMKRTSHMKNIKTIAERRALAESLDPELKKLGDAIFEKESMRDMLAGTMESILELNNNIKKAVDSRKEELLSQRRESNSGLAYD